MMIIYPSSQRPKSNPYPNCIVLALLSNEYCPTIGVSRFEVEVQQILLCLILPLLPQKLYSTTSPSHRHQHLLIKQINLNLLVHRTNIPLSGFTWIWQEYGAVFSGLGWFTYFFFYSRTGQKKGAENTLAWRFEVWPFWLWLQLILISADLKWNFISVHSYRVKSSFTSIGDSELPLVSE